jgi:hypothetical protein
MHARKDERRAEAGAARGRDATSRPAGWEFPLQLFAGRPIHRFGRFTGQREACPAPPPLPESHPLTAPRSYLELVSASTYVPSCKSLKTWWRTQSCETSLLWARKETFRGNSQIIREVRLIIPLHPTPAIRSFGTGPPRDNPFRTAHEASLSRQQPVENFWRLSLRRMAGIGILGSPRWALIAFDVAKTLSEQTGLPDSCLDHERAQLF